MQEGRRERIGFEFIEVHCATRVFKVLSIVLVASILRCLLTDVESSWIICKKYLNKCDETVIKIILYFGWFRLTGCFVSLRSKHVVSVKRIISGSSDSVLEFGVF